MTEERARLTIDIDPALHNTLKVLAARKGTTMREYCVTAIQRQLEADTGLRALDPDDVLTDLWDNEDDAAYDDL